MALSLQDLKQQANLFRRKNSDRSNRLPESFKKQVVQCAGQHKLSELAEAIGVHYTTVSKWRHSLGSDVVSSEKSDKGQQTDAKPVFSELILPDNLSGPKESGKTNAHPEPLMKMDFSDSAGRRMQISLPADSSSSASVVTSALQFFYREV